MYQFDSIFVEGSYMDVDFDGYLLEFKPDIAAQHAHDRYDQRYRSIHGVKKVKGGKPDEYAGAYAPLMPARTKQDASFRYSDADSYRRRKKELIEKDNEKRRKEAKHAQKKSLKSESVFDSEDPQYYDYLYEGGEGYEIEDDPKWHEPAFNMTGDDGEYYHKDGDIPSFVDATTPGKGEQKPAVGESFLDFELI